MKNTIIAFFITFQFYNMQGWTSTPCKLKTCAALFICFSFAVNELEKIYIETVNKNNYND